MCVIGLKYFANIGWVGVKNRDRNYKPDIKISQSFRNNVERLLLWDEKTKWTEGINEYGIAILNSATAIKGDEKEGDKSKVKNNTSSSTFYSPDGKIIRKLLLNDNIEDMIEQAIEYKILGNTIFFNKDEAYLLETTYKDSKLEKSTKTYNDFQYEYKKIDKDQVIVRTNHGIWLKNAGYQYGISDHYDKARKSSEIRYTIAAKNIAETTNYKKMLDAIGSFTNKNPQLNPLRTGNPRNKKELKTTGQILIVPSQFTLYYKPIWCTIQTNNFMKINNEKSKTFYEIISKKINEKTFTGYINGN